MELQNKYIAILPTYSDDDADEHCSQCSDDNVVVVIRGGAICHYCGNQVNLCSKCYGKMKSEIDALNLGF